MIHEPIIKRLRYSVLYIVVLGTLFPCAANAEEGGAGHYMPGATASFIDALPGYPSFAVENVFVFYRANASATVPLPVGGQTTLGLDATAYADSIVAFYETPLRLFGGLYAAGVAIPFVWMEADAQVGGFTVRDTASGSGATLGDFEGRTVGVGPAQSYIRKIGKNNLAAEVKWLPELETKNRLKGDYVWFKLAVLF